MKIERKLGGNIYAAHRQWAKRPKDECFESVAEMHEFCSDYRKKCRTINSQSQDMEVVINPADEDDLAIEVLGLNGSQRDIATFTNFSFGQVASMAGARPDEYLTRRSPHLVKHWLNEGWSELEHKPVKLLVQNEPDHMVLRAATSRIYDRVWNADVTNFLSRLPVDRFGPPTPNYYSTEGRGTGLYASDHDMFALIVDHNTTIKAPGTDQLVRAFMLSNNEVGTGSLTLWMVAVDYICGNHILWGVKDSIKISARHVGRNATEVFNEIIPKAIAIGLCSPSAEQEGEIRSANRKLIAKGKDKVVNFLFEKRLATRSLAERAYDYAEMRAGLNPNSYWGMTQGLTAEARTIPYYDKRVVVERSASKLLQMAI